MEPNQAIALVPVPPELSGLGYKAARKALADPRIRATAMAGRDGAGRLRWVCEWSTSSCHSDHLAVVAAAVAAAVQGGKMTPERAQARLDAAVAVGHKTEFVSFDDGYDQAEEADPPDTRSDLDADTDAIDALDAILKTATEMASPVTLPAGLRPCVEMVRQAALTAAGLLPSGVALAELPDMDHDAQVRTLRRLQRNWPVAAIPTPAPFIAAGSAQRTTTRDDSYGVIIGPLPHLLARDHASGLPKATYCRWAAWGRKLSRALDPPAVTQATQSVATAA